MLIQKLKSFYKYYGDNVKKCGNSIDTDKRKYQYTTSYLEESELLLVSEQFIDKSFEIVIKLRLKINFPKYRLSN